MKKSILILTLIVAFSACNGSKKTTEVITGEIPSGKYEIRSIQGVSAYKMYFDIDTLEKKIFGKTNCNSFNGTLMTNSNEIKIGPLVTTKMYCEENVMKVENSLFKAFNDAITFVYDNNMLTFSSENGVVLRAYRMTEK